MELKNAQSDTLLNDIAQSAATGTLTGGNFGTPATAIYLTFDYDVAAKYEVKLATVAGAALSSMSHISGADVAHSAGCKVGRMINTEVIDDIVSGSTLLTPLSDGWVKPSGTWSRASASSITVPSGAASLYSVGDKIKLTDTTAKYFYVTAVADTVLTVTGGTDYTVVSTISNYYYSKSSSPVGFPQWFAYTPTFTNFTKGSATIVARFCQTGKVVFVRLEVVLAANSAMGTDPIFSLPVASATYSSVSPMGTAVAVDTNPGNGYGGWTIANTTTTAKFNVLNPASGLIPSITATAPFTWGNTDTFSSSFDYEVA